MPTKKCADTTSGIKLPSNEKAPREPEKAWQSNFWWSAVFHFACCHRGGRVMTLLGRAYSRLPLNVAPTIFVTNDHADAMMLAGSIAVLRDAAIVQGAPAKNGYARPANAFVARLVGMENIVGAVGELAYGRGGAGSKAVRVSTGCALPSRGISGLIGADAYDRIECLLGDHSRAMPLVPASPAGRPRHRQCVTLVTALWSTRAPNTSRAWVH
jgi:hypothetical protein